MVLQLHSIRKQKNQGPNPTATFGLRVHYAVFIICHRISYNQRIDSYVYFSMDIEMGDVSNMEMFGYEFRCCRERNHIQHIVRANIIWTDPGNI
jgi:hypothetical protein